MGIKLGKRQVKQVFLIIAVLLILPMLSIFSSAQEMENSTYNFGIDKASVHVTADFQFSNMQFIDTTIDLPDDSYDITLVIDEMPRKITFSDEKAKKIRVTGLATKLSLKYTTKEFVKSSIFFVTLKAFYTTRQMKIRAVLPEGYTLKNPIKDETFETGSIYPIPNEVQSDGQLLVFSWNLSNIQENDNFSMLIIMKKKLPVSLIIIGISMILAAAGLSFYFYERKKRPKVIIEKVEDIEEHLKENEEQVVNILKQRGGSCEQGTLKVIMNLPKSTLSALISELEERKIVIKKKKGKKNLILLKK